MSVKLVAGQIVATGPKGFSVLDVSSLKLTTSVTKFGPVALVATMPLANIVAIVGETRKRVALYDVDTDELITDILFDQPVLNVFLNARRLVVVQAEQTHLFDLQTLMPQPQVRTTNPPNDTGLAALSGLSYDGECKLAIPQSADPNDSARGDVFLIDPVSCNKVTVVCAHRTRVTQIVFSPASNCFATASQRGNIIRLFSTAGAMMCSFKRGNSPATLHSVALSSDGAFVAAIGSSGTLHVFATSDALAAGDKEARSFAKLDMGDKDERQLHLSDDGRNLWVLSPDSAAGADGMLSPASIRSPTGKGRRSRSPAASAARSRRARSASKAPEGGPSLARYVIDDGKVKLEIEQAVPLP